MKIANGLIGTGNNMDLSAVLIMQHSFNNIYILVITKVDRRNKYGE
jgi:hypothetical protein